MPTSTDMLSPHQLLEGLLTCDSPAEIHYAIRAWLRTNPERDAWSHALARRYGYDPRIVSPALDELAEIARRMCEPGPGAQTFDYREWIEGWAHQPLRALGGQRPVHLLHTPDGVASVRLLLERMESGVYT